MPEHGLPLPDDSWTVAGRRFASRLVVGTGRYKDLEETARAIAASGAEMVTVAVRRVNLSDPKAPMLQDYVPPAATPTCPIPPAATRRRTRSARCAWRGKPAGGTW